MYQTLTEKEKLEFLGKAATKQAYKIKGHNFTPMKGVGKQVCKDCGLLALNNKITEWCIKKGCNYQDHEQYRPTLKRLTKMNWG